MKLIDIINGPWAITPAMLVEIRSIYAKHLRGEKLDKETIEAFAAANNVKKAGDNPAFEVVKGSAIIPVDGVLAKKMNLFHAISGGASTQLIERDIRAALFDPAVEQVILSVDSPGGTVDGTFELADFVFASRGTKPIITHASGSMYSAAYGIGSSASKVYISSLAAGVGSIGVVAAHEDWSKYEERMGVKTTEIYAGKYKRAASQHKPLDADGKKSIQDEVDHLYSVFVHSVARNRGVSAEQVLREMSTDVKSAFIGTQAVEAGLVDGVATLDDLIDSRAGVSRVQIAVSSSIETARAGASEAEMEEAIMDVKDLKEKHADLYQAVFEDGKKAGGEEGKAAGAAAERERIKAVSDIGKKVPGHGALIEGLMFDGKTTGPEAAVAVLEAEGGKRAKHRSDFFEDGKDVKVPTTDGSKADAERAKEAAREAEDADLPVEERARKAWDSEPKTRAEFGGDYEAFKSYFSAMDNGQVKIMKKKSE